LRIFNSQNEALNLRRVISAVSKFLVSVALLIFLFGRIELEDVLRVLKETRLDHLGWALGGYLSLQLVGVYRWQIVSKVMGFGQTFVQHTAFYFIGIFFNLFLPTTVGGDVGRCFYLAGERSRVVPALKTVLADRGCGIIALVLIASVALFISTSVSMPVWIVFFTLGSAVVLLVGLILPFFVPAFFQRWGFPIQYWERPRPLFIALLLSLGIQIATVWINQLIGGALGLGIPSGFYYIFTPLVMAASSVPISLNGLGVREGAYVYFLLQAGIDEATALAFGLLWLTLLIAIGMFGGLFWIFVPRPSIRIRRA
jgi:glycosyltransferase 2 family protein